MTTLATLAFVIAAGAALTVQAGINATLATWMGDATRASLVSSGTTALLLLAAVLVLFRSLAPARPVAEAPWWVWAGGPLGAFVLVAIVVGAPRLGAAPMVASLATGQAAAALVVDHYGVAGYAQNAVTPVRVLGAALVVVGLVLVRAA